MHKSHNKIIRMHHIKIKTQTLKEMFLSKQDGISPSPIFF